MASERAGRRSGLLCRTVVVAEAELIRRLGVPEKIARAAIYVLENRRDSGFPQKQVLWGNRRYWPAVKAWFDRQYGARGELRDFDQ